MLNKNMEKEIIMEQVNSTENDTKINDKIFDKKVEEAKEIATTLTPTTRTLEFNMDLANTMGEEKLFELYRQMDNDSIISSALDLFADNVAQENPKTGHVVSVTSADKNFEAEVNDFLHNVVNMDTESWNIVRSLAQFGKVVLDTKASNGGADWAFIEVESPEYVQPLTYGQDNIRYFAVKNQVKENNSFSALGKFYGDTNKDTATTYAIEPRDRYIVGFNSRKHIGKMKVETESALLNGDKRIHEEELYIRAGKSILEGVIQTWQTLSTLEDSLFVNRLLKSTAFNIVSIDVSDTNNKQAQQMIDEVKKTLRSSETIDKTAERYSNRQSPIPIKDFIIVPTKGEKGAITITQVGGEVGEIDLTDINYYRNKLFAGLGVLKAYLGFEETTPGGLGDTTLTMLDERFARTVKRFRTVLGQITKQMVEHYWVYSSIQRTLENIPEYTIELGKISTREEEANRKAFTDGIMAAENFLSVVNAFPNHVDEDKLFTYVFSELIGIDLRKIDTTVEAKEIEVTLKQLKEQNKKAVSRVSTIIEQTKPKYKVKKRLGTKVTNFMEANYKEVTKLPEVTEVYKGYDVYIKLKDGRVVAVETLLEKPLVRQMLGEKTYKDLRSKTKAVDPERIKKSKKIVSQYIGYDPDEDILVFETTAEDPAKNKAEGKPTSYEAQVKLTDLIDFIKARKTGETDLSLVRSAIEGNIQVGCECPASKYWGQQYNGTKEGYSIVKNEIEPTRNKQYQQICKHISTVLFTLPFHAQTIVRDIRQAGTFKRIQDEMTPDEEMETLDKIVDIETGGEGIVTKDTKKARDKKAVDVETPETIEKEVEDIVDKDDGLKNKVADKAQKTKKKPKK